MIAYSENAQTFINSFQKTINSITDFVAFRRMMTEEFHVTHPFIYYVLSMAENPQQQQSKKQDNTMLIANQAPIFMGKIVNL